MNVSRWQMLIDLMTKIVETLLQFVMTLGFFTLVPTGPLANADHH
jgi:hypothetical protein